MKTEVRVITPKIAREMLKQNPNNRSVNKRHIKFLADQMKNNQWLFDAQPIRLTNSGSLLDGQHRLNAIIESGVSQEFLIVSGISSDAFKVMDTGKNRSSGDVLTINGVSNASLCAATCKLVMSLADGNTMEVKVRTSGSSNTAVLEFYESDAAAFDDVVTKAATLYKGFNRVLETSVISALYYLMSKRNVEKAELFWNKLCYGIGLEKDSPIRLLRDRLIKDKVSHTKMKRSYKLAIIIKTWNHYRKGNTIKCLRISEGEKFPKII